MYLRINLIHSVNILIWCANSGLVQSVYKSLVYFLWTCVCVVTTKGYRMYVITVRKHYLWLNKSSTSSFPLSYTSQTVLCLIYYITLFEDFPIFRHILPCFMASTHKKTVKWTIWIMFRFTLLLTMSWYYYKIIWWCALEVNFSWKKNIKKYPFS